MFFERNVLARISTPIVDNAVRLHRTELHVRHQFAVLFCDVIARQRVRILRRERIFTHRHADGLVDIKNQDLPVEETLKQRIRNAGLCKAPPGDGNERLPADGVELLLTGVADQFVETVRDTRNDLRRHQLPGR